MATRSSRSRRTSWCASPASEGCSRPCPRAPPASFRCRRGSFVRDSCNNVPSGVIFSPEGASRTGFRPKSRHRRQFLAGGRVSYVIPSEVPASASIPRRRACLVRNPVRSPGIGVNSSPEGASRTWLRRQFLAGGAFLSVTAATTHASASFRRRKARLVRNPVENPGSGVTFSPQGVFPQ